MLTNLGSMINKFFQLTYHEIVKESMEKMKEIIAEFERLKFDYTKRVEMGTKTLSKEEQKYLNSIFSQIRYVLTRFGRLVSLYEVIL